MPLRKVFASALMLSAAASGGLVACVKPGQEMAAGTDLVLHAEAS
jgi:hypothetical protein